MVFKRLDTKPLKKFTDKTTKINAGKKDLKKEIETLIGKGKVDASYQTSEFKDRFDELNDSIETLADAYGDKDKGDVKKSINNFKNLSKKIKEEVYTKVKEDIKTLKKDKKLFKSYISELNKLIDKDKRGLGNEDYSAAFNTTKNNIEKRIKYVAELRTDVKKIKKAFNIVNDLLRLKKGFDKNMAISDIKDIYNDITGSAMYDDIKTGTAGAPFRLTGKLNKFERLVGKYISLCPGGATPSTDKKKIKKALKAAKKARREFGWELLKKVWRLGGNHVKKLHKNEPEPEIKKLLKSYGKQIHNIAFNAGCKDDLDNFDAYSNSYKTLNKAINDRKTDLDKLDDTFKKIGNAVYFAKNLTNEMPSKITPVKVYKYFKD